MGRYLRRLAIAAATAGLAAVLLAPSASAREFEVEVRNLTDGQPFTPPVAATHRGRNQIFGVGRAASVGVREIAENGNLAPLLAFLDADPFDRFARFTALDAPLVPGGTPGAAMFADRATFTIRAPKRAKRLSWISMLICTNDGFTGSNSLRLPRKVGDAKIQRTNAYDSRTEINTEDYADIVPPCQGLIGDTSADEGTGVSNPDLAQGGAIARHKGINGGVDLKTAIHDWDDPVSRIRVERVG